jgi:hypothetical protein
MRSKGAARWPAQRLRVFSGLFHTVGLAWDMTLYKRGAIAALTVLGLIVVVLAALSMTACAGHSNLLRSDSMNGSVVALDRAYGLRLW